MSSGKLPERRESYISTQLGTINSKLQVLFDELGLTPKEREARERGVYAVISQALETHVDQVAKERDELYQNCVELQSSLQEMTTALKDVDMSLVLSDPGIIKNQVKAPYNECQRQLQTAYEQIESIYTDRLVRVNKTFETLKELATKVDGISVANDLMLHDEDLDLSNNHIVNLESEVGRWQEEYSKRVSTVAQYASRIAGLWAELGTPQNEIDSDVLSCYRSNPEQLGTLSSDVDRLKTTLDELENEKEERLAKLDKLKHQIQHLWDKLSEDGEQTKLFDRQNRGLALTVLQAHEQELARLNEKKRQHIHVFIQDARQTLEQLWGTLYFSEDEMLEFTPAWTDIYTDASLDAHESEIVRLQSLVEERKPILTLIDEYYSLKNDAEALEASAQDASRLLSKGPGRRDPSRLLREEKMRKRIAKKKPKVVQELRAALTAWSSKNGKPFMVNGNDFAQELDTMEAPKSRGWPNDTATASNPHAPARSVSPIKSKTSPKKQQQAFKRPASPAKSVSSTSTFKRPPPPRIVNKNGEQPEHKRNFSQPQHQTQSKLPQASSLERSVSSKSLKTMSTNSTHLTHSKPPQNAIRIPSITGSTTSSENWEAYDDASSSDDEFVDNNYMKWREDAMRKLASGPAHDRQHDQPRVSEFDWDKDVF